MTNVWARSLENVYIQITDEKLSFTESVSSFVMKQIRKYKH